LISAGNIIEMTMAAEPIQAAGPVNHLIADRGYDTNAIRGLGRRGRHSRHHQQALPNSL